MKPDIIDIIKKKSIGIDNDVYYLTKPIDKYIEAEKQYLKARINENRIYSDSIVKTLPSINKKYIHYEEWKIRKNSSNKLLSYLSGNKEQKTMLELGCGNGWLSCKLSNIKNSVVIGMDINHLELEQGARVFVKDNLLFVYANIFDDNLNDLKFDHIILASSLSYFDDLEKLLSRLYFMLNDNGEIHLIDNPAYSAAELESAFQRSTYYYDRLLVPNMSKYYFHHDILEAVKKYDHEILYDPDSGFNKLRRKILKDNSPFYWIKLSK